MEIDHSSHPHRLILKFAKVPYTCYGCKELGFEVCYQCKDEKCNFYLHEECVRASSSAIHPFFKKCNFQFHDEKVGHFRICDACGKDVLGFNYQCLHEKAHDLHPYCLKLKHTLKGEGVEMHLKDKVNSKCLHCKNKEISKGVKGWSYVSSCGTYSYHVACVKEMVYENWKKYHFSAYSDVSDMSSQSIVRMVPKQDVVVRENESSSSGKYWRTTKSILKLIICAIFGEPTGLITAVFEILRSN